MNAERRLTAADLWTKPTDLSRRSACRQLWNCIHHRHLLLLSPKVDTHFTIPQRVEGRVDLDGRFTCLRAVTYPSSNRAQCRLRWSKSTR